jgi:hypothetical protein
MTLVEDDDLIHALPPDRADRARGKRSATGSVVPFDAAAFALVFFSGTNGPGRDSRSSDIPTL